MALAKMSLYFILNIKCNKLNHTELKYFMVYIIDDISSHVIGIFSFKLSVFWSNDIPSIMCDNTNDILQNLKPEFPEGWNPPTFSEGIPFFLNKIGACKLCKLCCISYYTKSIKNTIIIALYIFRLISIFTTDTCLV